MTDRIDPASEGPMEPASRPVTPRRRNFFRWVTYGLGGLAAAVTGLPIVGYLLGSKPRAIDWIDLGRVAEFAAGETRMVTFDNPLRKSWDGLTAHTGVYVRR